MNELIAHLIGDYILQSDWMANSKTTKSFACLCHVLTYAIPFLFLNPSWTALAVIVGTHFVIDRFRLAKYLVYGKNYLAPKSARNEYLSNNKEDYVEGLHYKLSWENCKSNGYPAETPVWLSTWLLIIADNALHLLLNHLALKYL